VPDLMIDFITSLDGYGAAEGWPGLWGLAGPEYLSWLQEPSEQEHTALLGRTTYQLLSGFAAEADDDSFKQLIDMPKVVFSSTLTTPLAWGNTTLVRSDPVDAVRALKRDGDRPLRTLGSLMLCRTLLAAGLVDRFRVVVFPVINGQTGRDRIYDAYPEVTLDLVRTRTFDGNIHLLEYVPTVLDGPPGAG
jgi:dihydrofolate reductase